MRWSVALSLAAALALGAAGCRSSNCDLVESQLRARESDVQHLKGELDRSEFHNGLLVRELASLRGVPGPHGVVEKPAEPYPVRSLRLGRGTGGRASDALPGDDALEVVLEPIDSDGQALKAPGMALISAQEVSREGIKMPLSAWEVSPDQLRRSWRSGFFNTGYRLTLPWKEWPNTERLRITATFKMLDGRVFEADRDVNVRVVPAKYRPARLLPAPTPRAATAPSAGSSPTLLVPATPPVLAPLEPVPMPDGPKPAAPADKEALPAPTREGPSLTRAVRLLPPVAAK